jgi:hypothetical protein
MALTGSAQPICPTCRNAGVLTRPATVMEHAELGVDTIDEPCPNEAWHNREEH